MGAGRLLTLLVGVLGGTVLAAATEPRPLRRPRPALRPPEHIVLQAAPVTIRLPVPADIVAELRRTERPRSDIYYAIRFERISHRADRGICIQGFARRGATAYTSPEDRSYVDYFCSLGRTSTPGAPPQVINSWFAVRQPDLVRLLRGRDYLPLTLVQMNSDFDGPQYGIKVEIGRVYLERIPRTTD